jgi:hypothetical protein
MTPEAYNAVKEWMDFRASYGEQITGDSWLMRDLWKTTDVQKWKKTKEGTKKRAAKNYNFYAPTAANPTKLPVDSIKRIILRAIREQGVRDELQDGKRRFEWKQVHGFRKWFKTRCEQVMLRSNVELLLSHSGYGMSQTSYYRPSEHELLLDYLKAVPLLSINDTKHVERLQQQMEDKEKEVEELKSRLTLFEQKQDSLLSVYNRLAEKFGMPNKADESKGQTVVSETRYTVVKKQDAERELQQWQYDQGEEPEEEVE